MEQNDFVNTEQAHVNERAVNNDPRELKGAYTNQSGLQPLRRKRSPWTTPIICVVALLVAALIFALTGGFQYGSFQKVLPTRAFSLSGRGTLVVNEGSGSLHVHTGNTSQVIVQGNEYARGFGGNLDDLHIQYAQDGNTITVSTDENWSFIGDSGVNFDITVPASIDVTIQSSSADVTVDNVNGRVKASTSSGNVHVDNIDGPLELSSSSGDVTLAKTQGSVSVHTSSGNVSAEQLIGSVDLSSSSGDLTLAQAQVSGQNHLHTSSGNIQFSGTLDPRGNFQVDSSSGSITLVLPANSSFQLTISTSSGEIDNAFAGTTVGNAPHTTIGLETSSGDIQLQKR